MKKLFALGAVAMISACGLFIDPDKLTEGNGDDPGNGIDGSTDTGNGGNDGGGTTDAANDSGDGGELIVEVPECVPPPLAGSTGGPYAVVTGVAGSALACPAGYLPTAVAQAKGTLAADPITCNDASCTCGAPGGTPSCKLKVSYWNDSACTKFADTPDLLTSNCLDLDSEEFGRLDISVDGVICTTSGSTTTAPATKPTPAFKNDWLVCQPDPNVKTAQCKNGDVPVPAASNASACVIVPTNQPCSGAYPVARDLSKAGTFNDARTCSCSCAVSPSSCSGGIAEIFSQLNCSGNATSVTPGTCFGVKNTNNEFARAKSSPSAGAPACASHAAPSGTLTQTTDLKLCCLGT